MGTSGATKKPNWAILESVISGALLTFALVVFARQIAAVWGFTVDDSFITFRYSQNIANGLGPIFSAGSRDEGYTSPLWMLLLVLPHAIGLSAELFSKIVGVACIIGSAAIIAMWAFRAARSTFVAAVAAALLLCFAPSAVHAVSGMETALFTLLLTSFSYLTFEAISKPNHKKMMLLAFAALAFGLARPEGNAVAIVGLISTFCLLARAERWQMFRFAMLLYVVPGVLYFAWRFSFYGQLMPLPFYLKVSNQTKLAGLRDVGGFLSEMNFLAGILIVCGGAFLAFSRKSAAIPSVLSVAVLLVFFLFPAHIMGYQFRYLFPVAPLFFLLAALGIGLIAQSFNVMNARRFATPALAVITLSVCLRMNSEAVGVIAAQNGYRDGLNSAHRVLGARLREMTPGVLAIGDAGAVPYFSRWKTIDTFGLNDRHIALHGHDADYVLDQNPDVIVLISNNASEFQPPLAHEKPLREAAVRDGFAKLQTLQFSQGYYLWVMAKPRSKIARELDQRRFADR
jgi:hypothetical protein